jgi:DNA invertase Pin-like site-specific DNA recombinase
MPKAREVGARSGWGWDGMLLTCSISSSIRSRSRQGLNEAIAYCREGDTLVVWRPDRF